METVAELLSRASYHRAADRGSEYLKAEPLVEKAARIMYDEGWTDEQIEDAVSGNLVSVDDIQAKMRRF